MRYPRLTERPPDFRLNPQAPLAKGLVFAGLGRHPKSLRYTDSSLFKNAGLLTNMAIPATPTSGWGWNELGGADVGFDGIDDVIALPASTAILGASCVEITLACRAVWITSTADLLRMITTQRTGSGSKAYLQQNAGKAEFGYRNLANSAFVTLASDAVCNDGASHSIIGTAGAAGGWLYVDGHQQTATSATAMSALVGSGITSIGAFALSQTFWVGRLSDILIYSRVLTPSEISAFADPGNVMLSGLILPPRRVWFPVAVAAPGAVTATARLTGAGAELAASAASIVSASGAVEGADCQLAAAADVPIGAAGAIRGGLGELTAAVDVPIGAAAILSGTGSEAAASGTVTVTVTGRINGVEASLDALVDVAVQAAGFAQGAGASLSAFASALTARTATGQIQGQGAELAASVSRWVAGPYRVVAGTGWHAGAAAGRAFHAGTVTGKAFKAGAVAGKAVRS